MGNRKPFAKDTKIIKDSEVVKDLSFNFYADLAIDKIRQAKIAYEKAMKNISIHNIRKCRREMIDARYLYREMNLLISNNLKQIQQIKKQDLT